MFVMWAFFYETDEALLERFEKLPFANKVAFTEMECSRNKSAFQIRDCGKSIGVLTTFVGLLGKRRIDQFDYVTWFNEGNNGMRSGNTDL